MLGFGAVLLESTVDETTPGRSCYTLCTLAFPWWKVLLNTPRRVQVEGVLLASTIHIEARVFRNCRHFKTPSKKHQGT